MCKFRLTICIAVKVLEEKLAEKSNLQDEFMAGKCIGLSRDEFKCVMDVEFEVRILVPQALAVIIIACGPQLTEPTTSLAIIDFPVKQLDWLG